MAGDDGLRHTECVKRTHREVDAVVEPARIARKVVGVAVPGGIELGEGAVPLRAYATPDAGGAPQGFPTPTRRVEIYSERLLQHGYAPVPAFAATDIPAGPTEFPLRLSSAKTVAYCHSQHRNIASLRRLAPDPIVEMARQPALARGIEEGDWVRIRTPDGSAVARAKLVAGHAFQSQHVSSPVFGQHGWWIDGPSGSPYDAGHPLAANLNQVTSTAAADPISGSIPLRSWWCEVEKI